MKLHMYYTTNVIERLYVSVGKEYFYQCIAGGVSDYILSKVSSIDHQLSSLGWQITSAHTDQGHLKDTVHNEWTVQSQRWISKSAHSFTSPKDIWQCTIWASNLSTTFSV